MSSLTHPKRRYAHWSICSFPWEDSADLAAVIAKCSVAPMRQLAIPRLELQAAVMAIWMKEQIVKEHEMKIHSCSFLWYLITLWGGTLDVLIWSSMNSKNSARQLKSSLMTHQFWPISQFLFLNLWTCPNIIDNMVICNQAWNAIRQKKLPQVIKEKT